MRKEVPFGRELCYNSSEERREAAMEKTLYVSDLDGTLLTPEQRLSPFTVRVLEYLLGRGWPLPTPPPGRGIPLRR